MKAFADKPGRITDLFFCAVFMPLLVLLGPPLEWMPSWPLFSVVAVAFLYGCYFVLKRQQLPRLLLEKDYRRIAIVAGALVAANYLLTLYPLPQVDFITPSMSEYQTSVRDRQVALGLWLMFSLVVAYSLVTSFVGELYAQLLRTREIRAQRDRAELAMFKAQISPHFLFNTLNSLYSLVIGTSQKAEDAFIKFTDILKYTYVTIENETVAIGEEAAYIGNYIDLQRIRLNDHTRIEWNKSIDDESAQLPPMLMLTFVENAFKYGASTARDCEILISLRLERGHLEFRTSNAIMKHADRLRTELPTGIENCQARLEGIYPGRYTLETSETDGVFDLLMTINLTPNGETDKMHRH